MDSYIADMCKCNMTNIGYNGDQYFAKIAPIKNIFNEVLKKKAPVLVKYWQLNGEIFPAKYSTILEKCKNSNIGELFFDKLGEDIAKINKTDPILFCY